MLRVGPESAGASPGPACYGQGGTQATVTDANLVLGRLLADAFLGGAMSLDASASECAIGKIAEQLGITVEAAAAGIIRVANEHMLQALRVISVQRGFDPRDFVLTSFGGAGGLHVCALAGGLGMAHALVPINAGVLSALGMLAAPRARQISRTAACLLQDADAVDIHQQLDTLAEQGRADLLAEGIMPGEIEADFSLDLRYQGQSYTLNVPWSDNAQTADVFHLMHETTYGHRLDLPVELVTLRCCVHGKPPEITLPELYEVNEMPAARTTRLAGIDSAVPVFEREQLGVNQEITGPVLITEAFATTFLSSGWRGSVDVVGNLLLTQI
jgi:N-methylhydantoinase A